jgi:hypothetical protein
VISEKSVKGCTYYDKIYITLSYWGEVRFALTYGKMD